MYVIRWRTRRKEEGSRNIKWCIKYDTVKIHSRFMAVKKTVCIDQDDRKYRKNIKVQEICLFLQIEVSTNQDGIYIFIFIYGIAIFLKYKVSVQNQIDIPYDLMCRHSFHILLNMLFDVRNTYKFVSSHRNVTI